MKNMTTLEPILADHPFFQEMKEEYLELLVGCAKNVRFEADEYVWRQGEELTDFYIIRHGAVAIEVRGPNKKIVIQTIGDGEIMGWSWLFQDKAHVSARARTLVRAVALDVVCLRNKMEEDHSFGYEMMKRFARVIVKRFDAARLQLFDMYK